MSFQMNTLLETTDVANSMAVLRYLLSTTRGRGSELATARALFSSDTRATFLFDKSKGKEADRFMAIVIDIPNPTTGVISSVFTSHLDTVEHTIGVAKQVSKKLDMLTASIDGKPSVLGADDGAGIAVLTHMIDNNVPGRYILTAGEESGGIGARWLVLNRPDLFEGIVRAIAFDRRGTRDVITSQTGEVGCSPKFAISLCDKLEASIGTPFEPAIGVYTDTAEMFDLVDNCTNVSVGYYNEHSANESLDVAYLAKLMLACVTIDWDSLDGDKPVRESYSYEYGKFSLSSYEMDDNSSAIEDILDIMQDNGVTLAELVTAIKDYKLYDLL